MESSGQIHSQKERLKGLDALRGIAAIGIVLFHLTMLSGLVLPGPINFFTAKFGIFVPVFFALSAFSLAYVYADKFSQSFDFKEYWLKRIIRIMPLYLFMLVVEYFFVLAVFDTKLGNDRDLFFAAAMLFPFVPNHAEGLVWASWAIGIELAFYLIFPYVLAFFKTKKSAIIGFIFFVVVSLIMKGSMKSLPEAERSLYYFNILSHMGNFLLGYLFFIYLKNIENLKSRISSLMQSTISWVLLIVLFISWIVWFKYFHFDELIQIYVLWFIALLFCAALFSYPKLLQNAFTLFTARISYSIYLIHPVIIALYNKLNIYTFFAKHFNGYYAFGLSVLATLAAVYLCSLLTYCSIEKPFAGLKKYIKSTQSG